MTAYRILLVVAIVATLFTALDGLIESGYLGSLSRQTSELAKNLARLWKVQQAHQQSQSVGVGPSNLDAQYIELPIDHNNTAAGTYQNRYWVNQEFYQPGGPVLVHDVGEVDAESSARRYLGHSSYLHQLLQEFHGIGIVWEHRYYGDSLPYPVNQSTPFEDFRFLSLNQSLADLPYFAAGFSLPLMPHADLTPSSTPWVMIGCSYSGLRAAISRAWYPDTFYAAYAASAPVQLQANLDTFFDPVYAKMFDREYGNCTQDLHAIMLYIDTQLSHSETASYVKQLLLGPGAERNTNGDFALAIANVYSYFQSHGLSGGTHNLAALCSYLEWDTASNRTAGFDGLTPQYGAEFMVRRLAAWPELRDIVNSHFNTSCWMASGVDDTVCDLGQLATDAGDISWTWQLCSELGLFVTQNPGSHSLVSRYLSLEYRQSLCARQFPEGISRGFLSTTPPVELINQETGGRFMRPSNVFWTAGEYDPWRALTPLVASQGNITQADIAISDEIPSCNTPTDRDTVFGYLMEDAQHCLDYDMNSSQAASARDLFARALRQWLPYFDRSLHS